MQVDNNQIKLGQSVKIKLNNYVGVVVKLGQKYITVRLQKDGRTVKVKRRMVEILEHGHGISDEGDYNTISKSNANYNNDANHNNDANQDPSKSNSQQSVVNALFEMGFKLSHDQQISIADGQTTLEQALQSLLKEDKQQNGASAANLGNDEQKQDTSPSKYSFTNSIFIQKPSNITIDSPQKVRKVRNVSNSTTLIQKPVTTVKIRSKDGQVRTFCYLMKDKNRYRARRNLCELVPDTIKPATLYCGCLFCKYYIK
eukprot:312228_1